MIIKYKEYKNKRIQYNGVKSFYLVIPADFIKLFNTNDYKNLYVKVKIINNELIITPIIKQ